MNIQENCQPKATQEIDMTGAKGGGFGKNLASIQALRGFAASAVIIHHAFSESYMRTSRNSEGELFNTAVGAAGVDLFFIISGFIMVYTTHEKNPGTAGFLQHRINRIYPLYWICMAIGLALMVSPWIQDWNHILANPGTYLKSVFLYPTLKLEGTEWLIRPLPIGQGWTLVYEMVFYGVFALALQLPRGKRGLTVSATLLALFGLGWLLPATMDWGVLLRDNIMLEFILGIGLAHLFLRPTLRLSPTQAWLSLAAGITGLLCYAMIPGYAGSCPRLVQLGFPCALIATAIMLRKDYVPRWPRMVLILGDASYSLYLVHASVFYVFRIGYSRLPQLKTLPASLYIPMILVAAIVGGLLLHYYVEDPLARLLRKRQGRTR